PRNKLGNAGVKDEGLVVVECEGAEGLITGNVLAGDKYSVAFDRTPEEILRIVYGSGDEHKPGGFYPKGVDGHIAKSHLPKA
ncbi:desiccation-related protein PCC13-62-like, partial [Fagus crenata]